MATIFKCAAALNRAPGGEPQDCDWPQCGCDEGAPMKIVTDFVYPPIPLRSCDWCAFEEGCEEDGNYGWGATEQEAIDDFLDNCVDQ